MKQLFPDTPITDLQTVRPSIAQRLHKLGIRLAKDLLYHWPTRYEDFSKITTISRLSPNTRVTVKGKIDAIQNRRSWKRRLNITEAILSDDTGSVKIIWFNQAYLAKTFSPGDKIIIAGKIELDQYGLHFTNPLYEKLSRQPVHTSRLIPIYPSTAGLTQRHIRYLIQLVRPLAGRLGDYLSPGLRQQAGVFDLPFALEEIHFPQNAQRLKNAQERLKFEELFPIQVYTLQNRRQQQLAAAPTIPFAEATTKKFVSSLPYTLTDAQRKAAWEIVHDLGKAHPMNRLVEGDVGSGKTVVVSLAVLNTAESGYQSVIMAPTELLAEQHFHTFTKLFQSNKIKVGLLTRNYKRLSYQTGNTVKKKVLEETKTGKVDLLIGTHALIQEAVSFHNLGLAVVDEQHRFGVEHRKLLTAKARASQDKALEPHFLSLTATPIPRTLALGLYGDLDISIIDEMPKGRQPIKTKIVDAPQRKDAYLFCAKQMKAGRQIFVICPLIDPSDKLGVRSVKEEHAKLQKVFKSFKVGLLHGRQSSAERERTMRAFLSKAVQMLVSTSVIEVGIDVPNATVMMIEGADRFGLAQLHQFRGRVGRGQYQSYCFLLTDSEGDGVRQRLQAVAASQNGFELAEKDLEMRGPGELYGLRQSGFPQFKIAKLTDLPVIKKAQTLAKSVLASDPDLALHPKINERMRQFRDAIHWE
ncbi:MAG: ATP-dependent DNA helicase RecG [bacterium]|nr:ATP-dependent DNA helicase RecG [bacterium]